MDRRTFLKETSQAALVTSALSLTAGSYNRVLGANDRIRLGQLGCGDRSHGHVHMAQMAAKKIPVEHVAVCDLWTHARQRRAAQVKEVTGHAPQEYKYYEDMLSRKDIDGVMIATGDFQHAKLCAEVVRAGKDCYVEKPFANVLADAKEARAVVKASKQVVQMGSQHRTQPYQVAVRDLVRTGRLGTIVKIEQEWNVNMQRWRGRPAVKELKEADTDWKRWLLGKPFQPFDPQVYLEFRLYKNFSGGVFDQWMSHGADLVHLWTDSTHPVSVVANGGIFYWKDGRENPDTATAVFTYPKGFMYSYTSTFANSYRSFSRIQGSKETIENYGGEGASLFMVTREGGPHQPDPEGWPHKPEYFAPPSMGQPEDGGEIVKVPGVKGDSHGPDDDDAHHLGIWLEAMRDRKEPGATIDHGFSHAICCIMAAQSYWSGKKLYWDAQREEIVDHVTEPRP
jgi:predicted dehydrogenase